MSPEISSAASFIPSSCLHTIFRAAQESERRTGAEVVKLHVGDPYFHPAGNVADAFVDAVRRGDTKYTGPDGLPELREAVVEKLRTDNCVDTVVDRVLVTPGSCEGLAALFQTLTEPGAEILLPELHWPVHLQQSLLAGLRPVLYPLGPGFRPEVERIAAAASPRTKVLLINSPANPTGVVLDPGEITALLDLARARGWHVVSDEAYEHFCYEREHLSVASLERDVPVEERIVHSVFSFSKSFAMTGYRLGYVALANDRAADVMRVVQEANIIGTNTPVQHAGVAALASRSDAAATNRKLVQRNRDVALPPLVKAGLLNELPAGGWYAMLDVARTGLDAETFALRLLERKGVAVVAGNGFAMRPQLDDQGHIRAHDYAPWARHLVRVAFCVDPGWLETGVRKILEFVDECGDDGHHSAE
ncbi:pyridoxal phosphate-dependent aminotransferase [Verrucosispora sp. WMMD703]|uniref:Aminotransferase n=1 Tax=Micromonospora sediminimaris TaxID=547162 RepID=A0A9W5XKF6_9ACTN|nr:pyridoxal phosphate-dependent aminotransferase [Micromonospora sediminimaris]GIJ32673.1 aminotransferase [Micromonospora sediminimaris]SFD16717.1 aspartate aminotransferase [Micromonospora sediminimaris]